MLVSLSLYVVARMEGAVTFRALSFYVLRFFRCGEKPSAVDHRAAVRTEARLRPIELITIEYRFWSAMSREGGLPPDSRVCVCAPACSTSAKDHA